MTPALRAKAVAASRGRSNLSDFDDGVSSAPSSTASRFNAIRPSSGDGEPLQNELRIAKTHQETSLTTRQARDTALSDTP